MKNLIKKLTVMTIALTVCITALSLSCKVAAADCNSDLYVGGFPFGIRIYTEGLVVVELSAVNTRSGSSSPAEEAGILPGDIIKEINGRKINSSEEFTGAVENSSEPVKLLIERNGETKVIIITPALSSEDGKYRTGMWLRDSTAGIGTVTFIVPETGEFCGLGHGICDGKSGELLPLVKGIVSEVQISGVAKGMPGTPGELKGYFCKKDSGIIMKNTEHGVYGIFDSIPTNKGEKLSVGKREQLHTGKASVVCTIDGKSPQTFSIEITGLGNDKNSSNFEITVTDDALIEKTGGIVQGMSGSPIIQDGALVGAVTHVMVSDPMRGYGIYIDKMLELTQ